MISSRLAMGLLAATLLVFPSAIALAQEDDPGSDAASAAPATDLAFSGSLQDAVTGSDTNACVFEDGDFRAQLTGAGASSILSFQVPNAAVGTYPIGQGSRTVSMVTLSDDPDEFLINWNASAGTVTISSLDAQVPVGDGSASTKGATGSIDADIGASGHGTVHVSGAWACHLPF
jgi:hypothetical protein